MFWNHVSCDISSRMDAWCSCSWNAVQMWRPNTWGVTHPTIGNTVALQCYMYATMECLAIPLNPQHHPTDCWHHHFCTLRDHLPNGIGTALLIGGPIITCRRCQMPSPSSPTAHNPNVCLWWLWWLLLLLEEAIQGWSRRKVGQVWALFEASVM